MAKKEADLPSVYVVDGEKIVIKACGFSMTKEQAKQVHADLTECLKEEDDAVDYDKDPM